MERFLYNKLTDTSLMPPVSKLVDTNQLDDLIRICNEEVDRNCSRRHAALVSGRPSRVRRMASMARTALRRPVSTTDLMSA